MTKFIQAARKGKGRYRRVLLWRGKAYWYGTPMGAMLRRRKGVVTQFTPGTPADRQITAALKKQGMSGRRIAIKPAPRVVMKAWMTRALRVKARYHYRQFRPMTLKTLIALKGDVYADCSMTATAICKVGGAPDPNGQNYNGTGYTGTIRAHATRISLASAKVGDMIVHGTGAGSHVTTIYEPHPTNPLLFSHGQESGPSLYRLAVQLQAHGSYFTVHSAGVA